MYTFPHYSYHHVWINFGSSNIQSVRVWPDMAHVTASDAESVLQIAQSPLSAKFRRHLDKFRHFPRDSEAHELIALMRNMDFPQDETSTLGLDVYITKFDLSQQKILKERIYSITDSVKEDSSEI